VLRPNDGLDRFAGMVIGRFEPAVGSVLGLGLMTTKPEPSWDTPRINSNTSGKAEISNIFG
jgi:hypothetical protein